MIGYIKNPRTFVTEYMVYFEEYDLIYKSVDFETSSVTVNGEYTDIEKHFFIFEDRLWIIKMVTPEDETTRLTLDDIDSLFSRELLYNPDHGYESIEEFMANEIYDNFINLEDTYFAHPYITVSYDTATEFVEPDLDYGVYSLQQYFSKVAIYYNVFVNYFINDLTLNVIISQYDPPYHNIIFDGGSDSQVESEMHQKTNISKITVNDVIDYYLFTDGTFDTDPTAGTRVDGEWDRIYISDYATEEELYNELLNTFGNNSESHSIEFYTTQQCECYDYVDIRSHGSVTSSFLTKVEKKSDDPRLFCKTGYLETSVRGSLTTVSQKIDVITKRLDYMEISSGGQGGQLPVGSIYMNVTNGTNPAILLGYGTWIQIGEGKAIISAGNTYEAGHDYGSNNHSHTLDNGFAKINNGSGYSRYNEKTVSSWSHNARYSIGTTGSHSGTESYGISLGGSTDSASNMQLSLAAYIWYRSA